MFYYGVIAVVTLKCLDFYEKWQIKCLDFYEKWQIKCLDFYETSLLISEFSYKKYL